MVLLGLSLFDEALAGRLRGQTPHTPRFGMCPASRIRSWSHCCNACAKKPNGPWPAACSFKVLRRLLRETQLSVVTVANQVGYSNPSHFAQVFRKHTGLSPSDYRRQR
ncbi:hypothetical protein HK44_016055 [Pseudomonas fluorescens HK44]|uniref:HTH araC/xylS-type domain-containing protein n=2 Tax=Pseudomonas fluorescens TaxID=294 RepID=A0A010THW6_PSEFL|nr:hypothetical protein HK44_016055 [Pseudomonas fluorescens HK44]